MDKKCKHDCSSNLPVRSGLPAKLRISAMTQSREQVARNYSRIQFFWTFILLICPLFSFANSISFAPPSTDISVGYLATLFGIVDGVLHGTGSQLIGAMFSVFNSAVMAIGGITVTYTMIISTVNTAHEGEMLGKEWNSIWIPLRATLGFALLIPKATGYCLMQVFVMWVIVQGAGAADKVWNAALDYLNRGGVIIKQQSTSTQELLGTSGENNLVHGAMVILSGQVCMIAMQRLLNNQLQAYKQAGTPPCNSSGTAPASEFTQESAQADFCASSTVPSFINTVDILKAETDAEALKTPAPAYVTMPNFPITTTPYSYLNGICGVITWNLLSIPTSAKPSSTSQAKTVTQSRATAVQQLYSDLQVLAEVIVNNDPQIPSNVNNPCEGAGSGGGGGGVPNPNNDQAQPPKPQDAAVDTNSPAPCVPPPAPATAYTQPYGKPLDSNKKPCTGSNCTEWGLPSGENGEALLVGSELQTALLDYNGVMQPTLVLMQENAFIKDALISNKFITQAKQQGWIMAGSYFFNLVKLNNGNTLLGNANPVDSDSGLDQSQFTLATVTTSYTLSNGNSCISSTGISPSDYQQNWVTPPAYPAWCWLLNLQPKGELVNATSYLSMLMTGSSTPTSSKPPYPTNEGGQQEVSSEQTPSNSVFGYLTNSQKLQLGSQPSSPIAFANSLNPHFASFSYNPPWIDVPCGGVFFIGCIGFAIIMPAIIVIQVVGRLLIALLVVLINDLLMKMIMIPIKGFLTIFLGAVNMISQPGINPIIALANMGTYYINFVANLFQISIFQIVTYIASIYGILLLPALAITAPLMISWASIMLSIGFITAYYIPMVPYLIFTFGSLAWFMAVIEAVVAAPIVALGIIHPEGQHKVLGKAEQGLMILMNVFLRPAMMIFGYITAIGMTYIGVWVLNAGFDTASAFMMNHGDFKTTSANANYASMGSPNPQEGAGGTGSSGTGTSEVNIGQDAWTAGGGTGISHKVGAAQTNTGQYTSTGGYVGWAAVFGYFFTIMLYTSTYMTIVEKAFTLISTLPDQILRWIGGSPEKYGEQSSQWAGEMKGKVEKAGGDTEKASAAVGKGMGTQVAKAADAVKKGLSSGSGSSEGGEGE